MSMTKSLLLEEKQGILVRRKGRYQENLIFCDMYSDSNRQSAMKVYRRKCKFEFGIRLAFVYLVDNSDFLDEGTFELGSQSDLEDEPDKFCVGKNKALDII